MDVCWRHNHARWEFACRHGLPRWEFNPPMLVSNEPSFSPSRLGSEALLAAAAQTNTTLQPLSLTLCRSFSRNRKRKAGKGPLSRDRSRHRLCRHIENEAGEAWWLQGFALVDDGKRLIRLYGEMALPSAKLTPAALG